MLSESLLIYVPPEKVLEKAMQHPSVKWISHHGEECKATHNIRDWGPEREENGIIIFDEHRYYCSWCDEFPVDPNMVSWDPSNCTCTNE